MTVINNKSLSIIFVILILFVCKSSYADDINLEEIEKALAMKEKSTCTTDPCPIDLDSLLDKLIYEQAKNNKNTPPIINQDKNTGPFVEMPKAELIVLNKITAKSKREYLNIGEEIFFGNVSIEVNRCIKNTDPFNSDNIMLLTIANNKIYDDKISIFHGWMVSSNPSLSTLEHPVYEVIPVNCSNKK